MIKYIISIVLLFFTGCADPLPLGPSTDVIYSFELNLDLEQDLNGYYHLPMSREGEYSTQSFHMLKVKTNNEYNPQMVYWLCDTFYEFEHMGFEGVASTILGPHMEQVGDTIQILTGYKDYITDEIYTINFSIILDEEE
jgi:hypothetical protein